MYRAFLAGIFLLIIIAVLGIGYSLAPDHPVVENPAIIPSYADYEGPYNIAGTPSYQWIVTLTWEFTDRETAAKFYRAVTTWENME